MSAGPGQCRLMENDSCVTETVVYLYTYISNNHLTSVGWQAELRYSGTIKIQKRTALFQALQSFVDCTMERSIRYNFWIDLESIQHIHLIIV